MSDWGLLIGSTMAEWGLLIGIGIAAFVVVGIVALFSRFYRKVNQGQALIINKLHGDPEVKFTGGLVLPIIHRAEIMDISVKTIEIDREGKDGLICQDNIRADIKVTFFVRVNKTKDDVLRVAQAIGCVRASDKRTLEELFIAKFAEALKTVGKQLDFVDLYTQRAVFKDQIVDVIGTDLNGYVLEDAAIDFLEQTPLSSLDENNILDVQGIRKITELTAVQHVKTNEFQNTEKKLVRKQDVERVEVILNLDRQEADAQARQGREIATVKAREQAETRKVQAEEHLKAEEARIRTEEQVAVQDENKMRQIEIARKARERAVLVETERVEKDRALEAITRERETELSRISKDKEVEKEKKEIQEVIRERVAVEKTVAEEEEAIKSLRVIEEATRVKDAKVIAAEGEAQEALVKDIKAAEAADQAAKFLARERLTMAEAELEATDKEARAKMRMAEGVQAEQAASGLAEAKVKEADAAASEKQGLAKAKVTQEQLTATARGEEAQGLARAKVKEADADATQKFGLAEATVLKERGTAEAAVVRDKGAAEGEALRNKLTGEANGLAEKAGAMKLLDEASKGHEEFRVRMETYRSVEMESIQARVEVARAQARLLGEAFKEAKIDIVGGDMAFIERVSNAVAYGKTVDGFVGHSQTMQTMLRDYLTGDGSLVADVKEVLTDSALSTADVRNLTLSAVLAKLFGRVSDEHRGKVDKLLRTAKSLGIDDLPVK